MSIASGPPKTTCSAALLACRTCSLSIHIYLFSVPSFNHTIARISKSFHTCSRSSSSKNPSPIPFFICLNDACPNIPLKLIFPIHCLRHPGFAAGVLYPAIQDIKSGPAISTFPLTSQISLSLCTPMYWRRKRRHYCQDTRSTSETVDPIILHFHCTEPLNMTTGKKKERKKKQQPAPSCIKRGLKKRFPEMRINAASLVLADDLVSCQEN